jgi:hypothetical protein
MTKGTKLPKATGRPFDENELIAQIGKMNIFAISGGRVGVIKEEGETKPNPKSKIFFQTQQTE